MKANKDLVEEFIQERDSDLTDEEKALMLTIKSDYIDFEQYVVWLEKKLLESRVGKKLSKPKLNNNLKRTR